MVNTILHDLRYAFRTMQKAPVFAAIAVASIALPLLGALALLTAGFLAVTGVARAFTPDGVQHD